MKKLYITLSILFSFMIANAQMSVSGTTTSENFDAMLGTSSTATLTNGFVVNTATTYSGGTTVTTQSGGTTGTGVLTSGSTGGTYNFANGITASATDRTIGFLTTGSFTSPRSLILKFQNNTGGTITAINVAFDYEKLRSGTRQFDWTFFHGSDGSTWTSNTSGDASFAADANNTTISNPPTTTSKSVSLSGLSISNGAFYYLRWTFTGLGGSTNGQAIGVDNLVLTSTFSAPISSPNNFTPSAPFCVTPSVGSSFTIDFTSIGSYSSNTYTAQLSDAFGSFASPVTIGTLANNSNNVTMSVTIPSGTVTGTGYQIRVLSNNPANTGATSAAFSINLASNSVSPSGVQTTCPLTNGTTLTVTDASTATAHQWQSSTTSGSGYTNITGATNSTYIPYFNTPGNYYIICNSTFACGTQTSNEVHVIVTVTDVTGIGSTTASGEVTLSWVNPACYDELMVIVKDAANGSISSTPSGDGTQYFDNLIYGDANANTNLSASEYDAYQGVSNSVTVSGLLNGTSYNFKIFTRKGTVWSSGVTISVTPNFALNHFQSSGTGNWNDYHIWNIWNGTSFVPAVSGQVPGGSSTYDVTISTGTQVYLNVGGQSVHSLTVNSGGKLFANSSQTSGISYIAVYSNIVCNGEIGNGTNNDAIAFRIEGATCTLSGTGTFYCARIKKEIASSTVTTLTISMNVNLTWGATALLNDCAAAATFNITINSGATVSTLATQGNVSIDGTNGADATNLRGTITVKGTLNVNGKLFMTTNNGAGSSIGMTITGTGIVNVDSVNAADGASVGHVLIIQNGGLLNIYGTDAFYLFGNAKNTFTCNSGSTVKYSASGAQNIESGIVYSNLTASGSGNKTINGNLVVASNLLIDAASFNALTPAKTLTIQGNITLQNGGTFNTNCKSYLDIATSGTYAQTFLGNNQLIRCRNFTSVKIGGTLSLTGSSGNTDLDILNDFSLDYSGGGTFFNDNGNTISVGDDAQIGGASSVASNFNFTGTLKFVCNGAPSATDIHLSDYGGNLVTVANLNNLTVDASSGTNVNQVQIFPSGGGQSVTVKGNVSIQNTLAFSDFLNPNNNTLNIKGNWSDYAATGFTEGTGQVILNGTTAQNITGAESFNKLEINNSNGVTVNNNTIITSELKLTNGKVTTGANEIQVTSNSVASVTGYSLSSYIVGKLCRTVASTGSYDFPLGDNSNYQLATIQLNSSLGISNLLGTFTSGLPATLPSGTTCHINGSSIYGILDGGYWTITPDAITSVNYDVTLNQRGYSNFAGNANQLGVIKRTNSASPWLGVGGTNPATLGTHNNATQSISLGTAIAKRSGVQSFSDFGVGIGGEPLPVTLSSFTLTNKENKAIALNWRTEAEINCNYYSVERSLDGIDFNSIGKINGNGTSDQPHTYQLTDYNPYCAESYYRLHQYDISGEEHLSNTLFANVSCDGILIAPNLVLDNLNLKFLSPNTSPMKITISNIDGRVVQENTVILNENNFTLNVSSLAAGLYFIHLTNGVDIYNNRFVKQ